MSGVRRAYPGVEGETGASDVFWGVQDGEEPKGEVVMVWERNPIHAVNVLNDDGNPSGGTASGLGLSISWQDGPLGREPANAPNGAFVDDVIEAARQRIEFYQKAAGGKFACRENALAITKLEEALHWLYARRMERERRGVQGTHQA